MIYFGNFLFGVLFALGFFVAQVLVKALFNTGICGG